MFGGSSAEIGCGEASDRSDQARAKCGPGQENPKILSTARMARVPKRPRRLGIERRVIRLASPRPCSPRPSHPALLTPRLLTPRLLTPRLLNGRLLTAPASPRPWAFGASSFACQIGAEMNLEIVGIAQELRAQIKIWVGELQRGAPRGEWLGGYSPPSTSSMAIVCTFARTSPAEIGG